MDSRLRSPTPGPSERVSRKVTAPKKAKSKATSSKQNTSAKRSRETASEAHAPIPPSRKRKAVPSGIEGRQGSAQPVQEARPAKRAKTASQAQAPAPTSRKRKAVPSGTEGSQSSAQPVQEARPAKRAKMSLARKAEAPSPPVINQRATETVNVFVFGGGENGELGLGPKDTGALRPRKNFFLDPTEDSALHVTTIACGGMHTVALTADNKVVTWGVNDNDALGRNTDWDGGLRDMDAESDDSEGELNPLESTPTAIASVHFGAETTLVSVAAGDSCSLALTSTGLVYGWGTFRDPEGNEKFGYSETGALIKKQPTPLLIQGLEKINQIACGANHALALDVKGNIWGWGCGHQNQFGRRLFGRHQDTLRPQIVRICRGKAVYIACGEYHCFAVDKSDNVWGWGLNSFGEAGDVKTAGSDEALLPAPVKIPALCGKQVTQLAGGAHHSAAVTRNGDCYVWGRLDGGQIGIEFPAELLADKRYIRSDERGKARICLVPARIPTIGAVTHVACGTDHTLFINRQNMVFATGFGSEGQLGQGNEEGVHSAKCVRFKGKQLEGQVFLWVGAGGQFSVVAGKPLPDRRAQVLAEMSARQAGCDGRSEG